MRSNRNLYDYFWVITRIKSTLLTHSLLLCLGKFKVLITPTLRKQYDLLGLDLEEDETDDTDDRKDDQVDGSAEKDDTDSNGSSDSAMSQLASACLACIMQFVIRTGE